jgi:leucyl-tRNA synthetase
LVKLLDETIKKVGDDIEALRLNTAIAQMMIFANAVQKAERVSRDTISRFLQVLAPLAPHITEELWSRLGHTGSIQTAPWPQFDASKLVSTEQKIIVQVNGKKRAELLVPVGIKQDEALELARSHSASASFLADKTIKRVVFVPGKILNIVIE